jgi:hypothetical protein
MARKFTVSLDLNKNELLNARLQNLSSDPSSPVVGQIYYNTAQGEQRIWDGVQWIAGGSVKFGLASARPAASKHGLLYVATDTQTLFLDNGSTWIQVSVNPQDLATAIQDHSDQTTGVHGVSGDIVGTSDSQYLTNKTLGSNTTLDADLDADGNKIVNLATPIDSGDAANKSYVDSQIGGAQLTFYGTQDEVEVVQVGNDVTIGLPDNVTITGEITADSAHILGSVQIDGDLNVNGNLNAINRTEINLEDNKIRLNTGFTGTPSADAGIIVERGDSLDAEILWNETQDQWTLTNDGSHYHAIARKYVSNVGDGTSTSFTVTHNLGTKDVTVQIYEVTGAGSQIEADVSHTSNSEVTVSFALAPSINEYRVVVVG